MIRPRVLVLLATMVALALVLVGCYRGPPPRSELGGGCTSQADCAGTLYCCYDHTCNECCGDYHCRPGDECVEYECVEPEECTVNSDCCDLHPGEVWKCDDGECIKVGCEKPQDCEQICPTGEWECEESFGDCVKPTPTPEPECTEDADCDGGVCDDGECVEAEAQCTENQECENLYGQGWECTDGECVEAEKEEEPTPVPLPEEERVLPLILGDFQVKYNDAFESENAEALVDLLHDVVLDSYGRPQCRTYFEAVILNRVIIEIIEATEIGPWTWVIDGLSIPVENAYEVDANLTAQGETDMRVIHLVSREDGSLGFLTDCGVPLPPESPPPLVLTDPTNDGMTCGGGESSGSLEPGMDLTAVEVATDTVGFELGRVTQLTGPIAGAMQGYHAGYPLIEVCPDGWYLDKLGHWNLGFICLTPNECEGFVNVVVNGEWTKLPGLQPTVWVDGNWVRMKVLWEEIEQALLPYYTFDDPATVTIMFCITDGYQCDEAGLGQEPNRLPTLPLDQFPFFIP